MFKKAIETRAKRIMSKATALGFTKNGTPMVIDQAREIVAAEEGHRNWHALRASLETQREAQTPDAGVLLQLVRDLVTWAEHTGGWEAPVWDRARRLVDNSKEASEAILQPGEYVLAEGHEAVWVTVDNLSAHLRRTDEGLSMSIYPLGQKDSESLAETFAFFNEGPDLDSKGWDLIEAHGDVVELQLQRDDEVGKFANDDEVWAHVIREAHKDPDSEAAKALTRIYLESPAEYRRLVDFDKAHERLLPARTSAGHPVDLAEVAEWVGMHYAKNFDSESPSQRQTWIDRFMLANADEDRFAYYLVSEDWSHLFSPRKEERTRWVLKLGGSDEGLVIAQVYDEKRGWTTLSRDAKDDLQESVYDNQVPETWQTAWSSEVRPTLWLPDWAQ